MADKLDMATLLSLALPDLEAAARTGAKDLVLDLLPPAFAAFHEARLADVVGTARQVAEFANELGSRFSNVKTLSLRWPAANPLGYEEHIANVSAYD